jgi:hypothetical protein
MEPNDFLQTFLDLDGPSVTLPSKTEDRPCGSWAAFALQEWKGARA